MAYKLNFQDEDGVLVVKISGERIKEKLASNSKKAWREIASTASRKNFERILVISRATGEYPAFDAYKVNSTLAECGVQRGWKIAFVNMDQDSFQEVKFAETIAVNRGFDIGVFDRQDKARKWLSETPGKSTPSPK